MLNNMIYIKEVSPEVFICIDELVEGVYIFRLWTVLAKHASVLLSCVVREEGTFECSVHALVKEFGGTAFKEIKSFKPLFEFLEFRRLKFSREMNGKEHIINI